MIDLNSKEKIELKDKRISVIGLGLSGTEAAKLANYLGARVFASDPGTSEKVYSHAMDLMHSHHIASETGIHSDKIYDADLWIISPGVPKNSDIVKKAKNKNIPIIGEIEFASWFTNAPIIAVTGSNGKTTTSYILSDMLKSNEVDGILAGNMGIPFSERVLSEIKEPKNNIAYILEISSFQMEFVKHFSPNIIIYTNISPDHLDRHESMEEYVNMKMAAMTNLKPNDLVIYNIDDKILSETIPTKSNQVKPFSIINKNTLFYLNEDNIYGPSKNKLIALKELGIPGKHNLYNFLAAATCSHLMGISENHIIQTMRKFKGVEHRLEQVTLFNGIEFINDSKATNIQSVIVAIESFNKPIILILGGYNKGANFRLLLPHIKSSHVRDVVSYGEAGGHINTALGDAVRSVQVSDLNSAVKKAQSMATPGDIVLLSPGCASFDEFPNFEIRGNYFKSMINNMEKA